MKISEAAEKSGLSADTIRFYERSGLVPNVIRSEDGLRRFSSENIEWLTLLYWLRKTGMPMKDMRQFARLYSEGDETMLQRKAVLVQHAKRLENRRSELDQCAEVLTQKIAIYDKICGANE